MDDGEIYETAMRIMQAKRDSITLLVGPPGTGKTRAAIQSAVEQDRYITIIRPPVPFGRSLGLLPGELEEKIDPWMSNIKDILIDLNITPERATHPETGFVTFASFEHAQGMTFQNSFIIIDEAQNCTIEELYILMTRIGNRSRMAISGDVNQKSSNQRHSGLQALLSMMNNTSGMNVVDFTNAKCYRSGLCADVTKMFSNHDLLDM